MSKILKNETIENKCHITIFDDETIHIDNIQNRCEPIELNKEQIVILKKLLDMKFLYGHDRMGNTKPVAVR